MLDGLSTRLIREESHLIGKTIRHIHVSWEDTIYILFVDGSFVIFVGRDGGFRDRLYEDDLAELVTLGAISMEEYTPWKAERSRLQKEEHEKHERAAYERLKQKFES